VANLFRQEAQPSLAAGAAEVIEIVVSPRTTPQEQEYPHGKNENHCDNDDNNGGVHDRLSRDWAPLMIVFQPADARNFRSKCRTDAFIERSPVSATLQ
jgi:hypothetical protein